MKGKAAVFLEPLEPMEIREYPIPEVESDSLLVKVRYANICGSDLHFWRGHGPKMARGIPQILGHEMTGVVYKLGLEVKTDSLGQPLKEGDRVVYSYFKPCGRCWSCLSGLPSCPDRYRDWLGVSCEEYPYFRGAYGEYYYMKRGHWIFKVPDSLSDELVSPINCALSEVIYGLHEIGITLGDTVVIQGAGGLGLYATCVAKEMGAGKVIVFDRLDNRLDLAKQFGADLTINVDKHQPHERSKIVKDSTKDIGADVVAEFTGSPEVLNEGLNLLRTGGRYLWIGNINLGFRGEIDPGVAVRGSKIIKGVIVYQAWVMPRALDFLQRTKSKYPFEKIISHKFKFNQINEAFNFASQAKAIRVALEF